MKRLTDRRTVLLGAVAATFAAAGRATTQPTAISGTITYEGGAVIPEGHLTIYLADPALPQDNAQRRAPEARIDSDGKSNATAFSLPLPKGWTPSRTLQVVARLERADGWLLARGSAQFEPYSPVHVTLHVALY
jgi:hypothetical protein